MDWVCTNMATCDECNDMWFYSNDSKQILNRFECSKNLSQLKILSHRKLILLDEYLFEGVDVVLLVEDEHGLFVVYGVNAAETQRTVAVGDEYGVAGDAGGTLVTV